MIETIILCGFLGSGKTTLLRELAAGCLSGRRLAVLINDFGELPVDAVTAESDGMTVAEVGGGSIFCVCKRAELLSALENIAAKHKPEVLVMEATGLAAPAGVADMLELAKSRGADLAEPLIVSLVDAVNYFKLVGILPAVGAQVAAADILILNKTDLVDDELSKSVENDLASRNPRARIFRCEFGRLPAGALDGGKSGGEISANPALRAPVEIETFELRQPPLPSRREFYDFLISRSDSILRAKGLLRFSDGDPVFLDLVNGVISTRPPSKAELGLSNGSAATFVLKADAVDDFANACRKL